MMLWKPLYNIVGMILYYDIMLKAFVLSASEGKILALIQALEFGSRVFNFECRLRVCTGGGFFLSY